MGYKSNIYHHNDSHLLCRFGTRQHAGAQSHLRMYCEVFGFLIHSDFRWRRNGISARVFNIETAVHIARKLIMITSRKFFLLRFFVR